MPTITPGYDFTINETPTFNKFLQQALNLTLSDLDFDDVDASVRVILNGQDSGGSGASMPLEGFMYYDPSGDLWVKTRWTFGDYGTTTTSEGSPAQLVDVPLARLHSGWATARIPFLNNHDYGQPVQIDSGLSNDAASYTPPAVYVRTGFVEYQIEGGNNMGWFEDATNPSDARHSWIGRGGCLQFFPSDETRDPLDSYRMTIQAPTGWGKQRIDLTNNIKIHGGTHYGYHPNAPGGSENGRELLLCWMWGGPVYSNGAS